MCIFCKLIEDKKYYFENEHVVAIYDSFPVNKGHTLIITKRHFNNFFDASKEEQESINKALFDVKNILDDLYHPGGYNIGVNVNKPAGQTIMHLHVHLIPRYVGDVDDPKGGVRGVIPNKQKY